MKIQTKQDVEIILFWGFMTITLKGVATDIELPEHIIQEIVRRAVEP